MRVIVVLFGVRHRAKDGAIDRCQRGNCQKISCRAASIVDSDIVGEERIIGLGVQPGTLGGDSRPVTLNKVG
jgi:hypothetical protein